MKCPRCGHEISEGHLICEECGYEIRVVPDFDPSVDEPIGGAAEILGGGAESGRQDESDPDDGMMDTDELFAETAELRHHNSLISIIRSKGRKVAAYVYICIIGVLVLTSFLIYQIHIQSLDYQLNHAAELIETGRYTQAEKFLKSAYDSHPESADILFLEADNYYKMKKTDKCEEALRQIAEADDYELEDREKAYDELIAIYDAGNDYKGINSLLAECTIQNVTTKYQNYTAIAPQFSEKSGNYDGVITLKLSANTGGDIYYTTDGTVPTEKSEKYLAPIRLETGNYLISAVFVNKYGISSDVSTGQYTIDAEVPTAPELVLASGNYTQPCMVTATAQDGCSIYYTVDNSQPTADSIPYTSPIPMPLGITNFKFIAVDDTSGNVSDITMRTYNLQLAVNVTVPMAAQILHDRMIATGYLKDEQGHREGINGVMTYKAGSVIRASDGQDYYTIYEYETDGAGGSMKTDNIFLVNIQTGTTGILKYDDSNNFIASPF
jgi:hypothetical protein